MKAAAINWPVVATCGVLTAFCGVLAITLSPSDTVTFADSTASITAPMADPAIERMKQCAHDLKAERQRWFFEETGITTTIDSGAAQAYANQLEAAGLEPSRPLPFRLCE
jgi:hypothetical protein